MLAFDDPNGVLKAPNDAPNDIPSDLPNVLPNEISNDLPNEIPNEVPNSPHPGSIQALRGFVDNKFVRTTAGIVAGCAVGGVVVVPVATMALGAVGFTSGGVLAGSMAAAIQSSIYGGAVGSGSLFAMAQSLAAGGVVMTQATTMLGVAAGGVVSAGLAARAKPEDGGDSSGESRSGSEGTGHNADDAPPPPYSPNHERATESEREEEEEEEADRHDTRESKTPKPKDETANSLTIVDESERSNANGDKELRI